MSKVEGYGSEMGMNGVLYVFKEHSPGIQEAQSLLLALLLISSMTLKNQVQPLWTYFPFDLWLGNGLDKFSNFSAHQDGLGSLLK